jgi:hypothetical protein
VHSLSFVTVSNHAVSVIVIFIHLYVNSSVSVVSNVTQCAFDVVHPLNQSAVSARLVDKLAGAITAVAFGSIKFQLGDHALSDSILKYKLFVGLEYFLRERLNDENHKPFAMNGIANLVVLASYATLAIVTASVNGLAFSKKILFHCVISSHAG